MLNISKLFKSCLRHRPFPKCLCSSDSNLPAKKNEMPKELTSRTDITSKLEAKRKLADSVTKDDMEWRTPWHQKEANYYSMLRSFYSDESNAFTLKLFTQEYNMTPTGIKNWLAKKKKETNVALQQYIPERNQTLGDELAAAHFIVHRSGAVKFYGDDKWIKANALNQYSLPKKYQDDMFLQAIDCTNMELYYEGLVNLKNLKQVEWLSLNGCEELDDWALDRIGNSFSSTLLYLDLRNMPLITYRGLGSLYKLEQLKILYLDDIYESNEIEMTCLMLQQLLPSLDIRME